MKRVIGRAGFGLLVSVILSLSPVFSASAQTVTKIVDHGPDSGKLVLAILGDGYAQADQQQYTNDVDRLIVNGLLTHDFYQKNAAAFNVYRVDLVSKDSGVSSLTNTLDTALEMIYSGDWNRCWMEKSTTTDGLISNAITSLKKFDYVLVILNETNYGGCSQGGVLFVTRGIEWDTVAHEYGHSIGGLYDEYWVDANSTYSGPPINDHDVSTVLNRSNVVWASMIDPATPIPTTPGPGMDPNRTVGMFEGADYVQYGCYRPAYDCRMRTTETPFCPVCESLMQEQLDPYLVQQPQFSFGLPAPPPASQKSGALATGTSSSPHTYLQMVVKITDDGQTEVLKTTELPGEVVLREKPMSDFVYELSTSKKSLVAEALPQDPFTERSVIDSKNNRVHFIGHTHSAIVIVKVPNLTRENLPEENLNLRLFKIKPGAKIESVNSGNVEQLNAEHLVNMQYNYAKPDLRQQIMEKFRTGSGQ